MDIVGRTIVITGFMLSVRPWQRISSHSPRVGAMTCPASAEGSLDWSPEMAGVSVLLAGEKPWVWGRLPWSTSEQLTARKYYFVNLTHSGFHYSHFQFHLNHGSALIANFMQFCAKAQIDVRDRVCVNWIESEKQNYWFPYQALDTVSLEELKVNQVAAHQIIVESPADKIELWTSYFSDFFRITPKNRNHCDSKKF